jgi:Nucleotidyl transferase AbiEii toxin, Type IV TA system
MLRRDTVSAPLLEALTVLMDLNSLRFHRLVGGTALALQLGHRISVDIDLFSDHANNYENILDELSEAFGRNFEMVRPINSFMGKGVAVFINGIKADILDWKVKFIRPPVIDEKIRLADIEDIVPMKFNSFLGQVEYVRYEKKDFIDIATVMKDMGLARMVDLYKEKYSNEAISSRLIVEGLKLNELADKKIMPKMLHGETWDWAKEQIEKSIAEYLKPKVKKK